MKNIMENLFALQTLQLQAAKSHRNRPGAIAAVRKTIPVSVLRHYDRLVAHGKKAVAVVRNGVCTECHIGIAIGALADLAHEGGTQVCGNCGRYLFLPDNEPIMPISPSPRPVAKAPIRRTGGMVHAHAG